MFVLNMLASGSSPIDVWKLIIVGLVMTLGTLCRSRRYKRAAWQYCASFRGLLEIGGVETTVSDLSPY